MGKSSGSFFRACSTGECVGDFSAKMASMGSEISRCFPLSLNLLSAGAFSVGFDFAVACSRAFPFVVLGLEGPATQFG